MPAKTKAKPKKAAVRSRKRTTALAAATVPSDPSPIRIVYVPRQASGVRVTEDTALTIAAVWACITVVTEAMATMPWRVMRHLPGKGAQEEPNNSADWILNTQASPEMNAFTFRETIIAHCMLWGNGYAEIERDRLGRPAWLHILTPDRVYVDRDERGRIVYDVYNHGEPNTVLFAEDVYHLKALGFDGLIGYDVAHMAARSMGIAMAGDEYAGGFWGNDATPGGILTHPGKLTTEARDNLRTTFEGVHRGPKNVRRLAILEEGMKWEATGTNAKDSQATESRQFQVTEICRWFRVPPHKVFDLLRATFSNIEQQEISFAVDCLGPWAKRLESEANIKFFGRNQQGTLFTKLNMNSRLRGDATSRSAFYNSMLDRGVFCINDVLHKEDMNSIGPDGDKRFVPLNMQLLEKAGEDQPEPPSADEPPAPDDVPSPDDAPTPPEGPVPIPFPEDLMRPLVQDALARIMRREAHRTEDALRRLTDATAYNAWVDEFLAEHAEYCRKTLGTIIEALRKPWGDGTAQQTALGLFLGVYVAETRQRLLGSWRLYNVGKGQLWFDTIDQHAAGLAVRFLGQVKVAMEVGKVGK